MFIRILISIVFFVNLILAQSIVDISVKGISDAKNDGAQKDREEAILDAKRQACEKAGIAIESKTMVKNFAVLSDYVESQSKGVLLPGFQIIDVGYVTDGTYQVVLSGKIKTKDDDVISAKELRYAKTLQEKGEYGKSRLILENLINNIDDKSPEELKEQAHYFYIRWGFAFNASDEFDKFSSYYPDSKYNAVLKDFVAFAKAPLFSFNKEIRVNGSKWQKAISTKEENTFDQKIPVILDTIIIKDYKNAEHSLVLQYTFLRSTVPNAKVPFAYTYSLYFYNENLKKQLAPGTTPLAKQILDEIKTYPDAANLMYQVGRSNARFGNFSFEDFSLKGEIPTKQATCPQNLVFSIYQKAF